MVAGNAMPPPWDSSSPGPRYCDNTRECACARMCFTCASLSFVDVSSPRRASCTQEDSDGEAVEGQQRHAVRHSSAEREEEKQEQQQSTEATEQQEQE